MSRLFVCHENKEHLAAVRRRREALRTGPACEGYRVEPRPTRVALLSRAQKGAKTEAQLFHAMIEARR
jgi:hypothetical protein